MIAMPYNQALQRIGSASARFNSTLLWVRLPGLGR